MLIPVFIIEVGFSTGLKVTSVSERRRGERGIEVNWLRDSKMLMYVRSTLSDTECYGVVVLWCCWWLLFITAKTSQMPFDDQQLLEWVVDNKAAPSLNY